MPVFHNPDRPNPTTKSGASTVALGNHSRDLDAAITHLNNHLERYSGEPIEIELAQVPADLNQREYQIWEDALIRLYETAGGWSINVVDRLGITFFRFE